MAASGKRLRELIAAPEILVLPGAWDGLSAILIAQAGCQGVYVTGGGIARSTGVPDIGLITLHEQVARVKMIYAAVAVPVLADADTGYGNAINLMRTVREIPWTNFEEAFPAFLTVVGIPLTYNISYGIGFGFISHTLIKIFHGKAK